MYACRALAGLTMGVVFIEREHRDKRRGGGENSLSLVKRHFDCYLVLMLHSPLTNPGKIQNTTFGQDMHAHRDISLHRVDGNYKLRYCCCAPHLQQ